MGMWFPGKHSFSSASTHLLLMLSLSTLAACSPVPGDLEAHPPAATASPLLVLPPPRHHGSASLEQALLERRSVRSFSPEPVELTQVSQLLWAAQGITHPDGLRTAPSAGGLYPLEIYLLAGNVSGLAQGIYSYHPDTHALALVAGGDQREALYAAALEQQAILEAAAVLMITALPERTTGKYGTRGIRYVHMEVGFVAENIYLQAQALGLGTVFIGAFEEQAVRRLLNAGPTEQPLGLMPVGVP